eukprot:scaffold222419_cov31-Prasinocladus_malaysianus.AAC.2
MCPLGTHLAQRLCDKNHAWDESGLASLIPNGLAQGLAGYAFGCPDMIGGGQYSDFYELGTLRPRLDIDQELFVRYAQAAACSEVTSGLLSLLSGVRAVLDDAILFGALVTTYYAFYTYMLCYGI